MRMLAAIVMLDLWAVGLAIPAPGIPTIVVEIAFVKTSPIIELAVKDKATSEILATSASGILDLGGFAISAHVDKNTGAGNLTVDGVPYVIHQDPAFSGGIICGRIFNDREFFVTCDVNTTSDSITSLRHQPQARQVHDSEARGELSAMMKDIMAGGGPAPEPPALRPWQPWTRC